MAASSLMADDICRHISFLKNRIAETLNVLQGLLFLSCDMFEMLRDMEAVSDDMSLTRQWRDLATKLQED